MATRWRLWKLHPWKSIASLPYTQVMCYWSLDLIFIAKFKLRVRKPKKAIWPPGDHFECDFAENQHAVTMRTCDAPVGFGLRIQRQIKVRIRKPNNSIWLPGDHTTMRPKSQPREFSFCCTFSVSVSFILLQNSFTCTGMGNHYPIPVQYLWGICIHRGIHKSPDKTIRTNDQGTELIQGDDTDCIFFHVYFKFIWQSGDITFILLSGDICGPPNSWKITKEIFRNLMIIVKASHLILSLQVETGCVFYSFGIV